VRMLSCSASAPLGIEPSRRPRRRQRQPDRRPLRSPAPRFVVKPCSRDLPDSLARAGGHQGGR
jgi:hypothetical protein